MNIYKHLISLKRILSPIVILAVILAACSTPNINNGSKGPEDPPVAVSGILTLSNGQPAVHMELKIQELDSSAPFTAQNAAAYPTTTRTDADGRFTFSVSAPGDFGIYGESGDEGIFHRVTVKTSANGALTSDPIVASTSLLGSIQGQIASARGGVRIGLIGTPYFSATNDAGEFGISRVPEGTYEITVIDSNDSFIIRTVTVAPGRVTHLDEPLEFGVTITSVSPSGIVPIDEYKFMDLTDSPEFTQVEINGKGFGPTRGLSKVSYAGVDLTFTIEEWSDSKIVLQLPSSGPSYNQIPHTLTLDDLRFTVTTPTGVAKTAVSAIIDANIFGRNYDFANRSNEHWVHVILFRNLETFVLQVDLEVINGRLIDSRPPYTSHGFYSEPLAAVQKPIVTVASLAGVELAREITGNFADISVLLDPEDFVENPYKLRLGIGIHSFTGEATVPFEDDGKFSFSYESYDPYPQCDVPPLQNRNLSLSRDGTATIDFATIFESGPVNPSCYGSELRLRYDGIDLPGHLLL